MIYALKHPYEPIYKVGFTADVDRRMREYLSHGMPVKPLLVCPGGRDRERSIHALLRDAWHGGEWFACSREALVLAVEASSMR